MAEFLFVVDKLFFLRPDAAVAMRDELIRRGLPRYVRIVENKLPAKYLIAKRVAAEVKGAYEELWQLHSELMKEFCSIQREIDSGATSLDELEKPEFSLLDLKALLAKKVLEACELCERRCGTNRLRGEVGFCKATSEWRIFGAHAHYGEEAELVPSGTIFQAACSMKCVYCQNAPESFSPELGATWSVEDVAKWVNSAKQRGLRNVNWVGGDPTPWLWNILEALRLCEANIAQVWNSNAYYSEKTMQLIDGAMDVYLLDFRYFSPECGVRLSKAPNYPEVAKRNHLYASKAGELIIRILVMPNHLECDAKPIVKWISKHLNPYTRVNILPQYRPCWRAWEHEELSRPLSYQEWEEVVEHARKLGLRNLVRD